MAGKGAQPGNKYGLIAKTPESRRELFLKYIHHIEMGLTKQSFPYCDHSTIDYYVKNYPLEFDAERIAEAFRKAQTFWEYAGIAGMLGKVHNFNAQTWKFNMKNRYGWRENLSIEINDKRELTPEQKRQILLDGVQ